MEKSEFIEHGHFTGTVSKIEQIGGQWRLIMEGNTAGYLPSPWCQNEDMTQLIRIEAGMKISFDYDSGTFNKIRKC